MGGKTIIEVGEFRVISSKIKEIYYSAKEMDERDELSSEEASKVEKELMSLYNELGGYDFRKIPKEEWAGMSIGEFVDLSFSNAKLDYSLLNLEDMPRIGDLRGCEVTNFPFEEIYYSEDNFDEEFRERNNEYFISQDAPENLKDRFYSKQLLPSDIVNYSNILSNKEIENRFDFDFRGFIDKVGYDKALKVFKEDAQLCEGLEKAGILDKCCEKIDALDTEDISVSDIVKVLEDEAVIALDTRTILSSVFENKSSDEIFGLKFRGEHSELFLPGEVPEELKQKFFIKDITFDDIDKYKDIIKDMNIENSINFFNEGNRKYNSIAEVLGKGDFIKLYIEDNSTSKQMATIAHNHRFSMKIDNFSEMNIEQKVDAFMNHVYGNLMKRWNKEFIFKVLEKVENAQEILKIIDDSQALVEPTTDRFIAKLENGEVSDNKIKGILLSALYLAISFGGKYKEDISDDFENDFPELFLDKAAPVELKETFYSGGSLTFSQLHDNPEWEEYLRGKNVSKLVGKGKEQLIEMFGQDGLIHFGTIYGEVLDSIIKNVKSWTKNSGHDMSRLRDELEKTSIYSEKAHELFLEFLSEVYLKDKSIRRYFGYDENVPNEFKNKLSELFLPTDAPVELKEIYYSEKSSDRHGYLTLSKLQENPEWVSFLRDVDRDRIFNLPTKCLADHIGMEKLIHFGILYGNTTDQLVKLYNFGDNQNHVIKRFNKFEVEILGIDFKSDDAHQIFRKFLYDVVNPEAAIDRPNERLKYDENVPQLFKEEYPELFLSKDAPEQLKQKFYHLNIDESNRMDYYLRFKDLVSNPEWQEFLKEKNIQVGMPENYSKFFEIFGLEAGTKLGFRQGENVDILIRRQKEELMKLWVDKCKFLPHHIVITNYPVDEIDKFIANGKRWSQLMKLDKYNARDDDKLAILKAGMVMGIFEETDKTGLNKLLELVTRVPMTISQEEFAKCMEKDPDLSRQVFIETKEGRYGLKVDSKEKEIYKQVHNLLEKIDHPYIMTVEKAQLIFNAMDMKFRPEFKKFFLDNIERIISNSEIQNYIGQLQKRFEGFEEEYQNKKIWSLELAMRYLNDTKYDKVKTGSEELADLSKKWGYSQKEFEFLQKVYTEGKKRKASNISRIQGNHKEYSFEMLRLDDPLPLVIGPETECCQKLDDAGETCMHHSMIEKNGRLFVLKDNEGKIVAQSWVWRNKNVICFDNIEIPKWIKQSDSDIESKVLEVYQKAASQMIKEEQKKIKTLLDKGLLGFKEAEEQIARKITVGMGYTDITLTSLEKDSEVVKPIEADKMYEKYKAKGELYTNDSSTQYILYKDEKYDRVDTTESKTIARYTDELNIFEGSQINENLINFLRRLEKESHSENPELAPLTDAYKAQDMAEAYDLDEKNMRVIKGVDWFMVYEENEKGIKIGAVNRAKEHSTKGIHEMAEAIEMLTETGKELAVTTNDISTRKLLYFYANKDKLNLLESEKMRYGRKLREIKVIKKKELERVEEFGGR